MNNTLTTKVCWPKCWPRAFAAGFPRAMLAETLRMAGGGGNSARCGTPPEFCRLWDCWRFSRRGNFQAAGRSPPPAKKTRTQGYELVRTQPLRRRNGQHAKILRGRISRSVAKVNEVATVSGGYRLINDNELLALWRTSPQCSHPHRPHRRNWFCQPGRPKRISAELTADLLAERTWRTREISVLHSCAAIPPCHRAAEG